MAEQFSNCPQCHSEDIEYKDYEFDNEIWQPVECNHCGFSWQAVYKFSHNETVGDCFLLDDNGNRVLEHLDK